MADNNVHAYFIANQSGPGEMEDISTLNAYIHSQIQQQNYIPVIFNHASNPDLILANFKNSLTFANILKILKKDMVGICTSSYIHKSYLIVRLTFPSKKIIPFLLQNCSLSLTQTNKRVIEMSLIVDKQPRRPFCKLVSIMSSNEVIVNKDAPVSEKSTVVHEAEKTKPNDASQMDDAKLGMQFSNLQELWHGYKNHTLDPHTRESVEKLLNNVPGSNSKLYKQLQQALKNLKQKESECNEQERLLKEADNYKGMVKRCKQQLMNAARNTGKSAIASYSKNNDDELSLEMVSFLVAQCLSDQGRMNTNSEIVHPPNTKRKLDLNTQSTESSEEMSSVPFQNTLLF